MTKNIKVKSKYIAPSTGYFEIDNGKSVYRLMEKRTASMTQDKLAELYESEKKKGNPIPMNAIQSIELFNDAMNSGDPDLLNFLQKELKKWPNTLTRVIYNPKGQEDETIHNYGTSDAYSVIGNVVGKEGWIKDIDNPNALELLLKTKDIKRLNEISNAINQTPMYLWRLTPMYLWRLNSKPSETDERVVTLYAYGDQFNLNASRYLSDEYPAFLVEQVK